MSQILGVHNKSPYRDFINTDDNLIDVPHTEIKGRAKILDPAANNEVLFGVRRLMIRDIYIIENEVGPNGEPVYGITNDPYDQVRLVGNWIRERSSSLAAGTYVGAFTSEDQFIEVTFYGNDLNLLTFVGTTSREVFVSTDGGAEGSNIVGAGDFSIGARGYNGNCINPASLGLAAGVHTVKLRFANGATVASYGIPAFGLELINTNNNILVNPGSMISQGKSIVTSQQVSTPYNSGFESGILGAKGGHVLVYRKKDGSVGKAVTPTDASQLNLSSADHSNEEVISRINYSSFGTNRGDDFHTDITSNSDASFTASDGTTTLALSSGTTIADGISLAVGGFLKFQFVGTGLSIGFGDFSNTPAMNHDIDIDGVSIDTASSYFHDTTNKIIEVCSGLPYGTHTVTITRVSGSNNPGFRDFYIYGPKKPELPNGATPIGSYFLPANFSANSTAGLDEISTGVIRKNPTREFKYSGTVTVGGFSPTAQIMGQSAVIENNGGYLEYTFFGTGFDFRFRTNTSHTSSVTLTLDGNSDFQSYTTSTYGGCSFTDSTGVLDPNNSNTNGAGVVVSGLPLGLYTFRATNNQNSDFVFNALDIIAPVHAPALTLNTYNNEVLVGNMSINDERQLLESESSLSRCLGQSISPSNSSSTEVPIDDLATLHYSKTGRIRVDLIIAHERNSASTTLFNIYVNGVEAIDDIGITDTARNIIHLSRELNVPVGLNFIQIRARATGGTATYLSIQRELRVKDTN